MKLLKNTHFTLETNRHGDLIYNIQYIHKLHDYFALLNACILFIYFFPKVAWSFKRGFTYLIILLIFCYTRLFSNKVTEGYMERLA